MCSARARLCFRYKTCTTLQSWYLRKHLSWRNFQILDLRRTCPLMTHPHHKVLCHFQYWRKQKCGKREKNMNRVPCGCWLYRRCVPQPPDTNFAWKFKFSKFLCCCKHPVHLHSFSWYIVSCFRFRRDCALLFSRLRWTVPIWRFTTHVVFWWHWILTRTTWEFSGKIVKWF